MHEDYYYNIIQSMVDTLFVVDLEGRIKTINRSLLNLLGYKEEELIGKPAGILFRKDKNFFNTLIWRKLIQEGVLRNIEMSYLTKERQEIPLSFSGSVMRSAQGQIMSVVFVNKDLSLIKCYINGLEKSKDSITNEMQKKNLHLFEIESRLEDKIQRVEDLENMKTELEIEVARRTNELKEAFTQLKVMHNKIIQEEQITDIEKFSKGAAHEIRNPLTFIVMSVQYVFSKLKPNDSKRKLLEPIIEKIDKVKEVTTNLVQFSRTYKLDLQPVEIDRVLDKIIDLVKPRCAIQNIEIIKEYNSNLPKIMADHEKIEELVFSLVDNALKAVLSHGTLTIAASYNSCNTIMIRISDTGKGIPEENKEKIFEPFFSTTGRSGLGLFIVKRIVEAHKGRIAVEQTNEKGTTFSVVLPLQKLVGNIHKVN